MPSENGVLLPSGHLPQPPLPDSFDDYPLLPGASYPSSVLLKDSQKLDLSGAFDTATLAAHDFDVDQRTGFMPPSAPLRRLPDQWEAWEAMLDVARGIPTRSYALVLGTKASSAEAENNARWHHNLKAMPLISTAPLEQDEVVLRRAHMVLAWLMHFYVHSLPPSSEPVIPEVLGKPLLAVSKALNMPPVLTYSDDVLYNTTFPSHLPSDGTDGGEVYVTFTPLESEKHFYLTSARIELVGVRGLRLMQLCMDEAFVLATSPPSSPDTIAITRLSAYLCEIATIIEECRIVLLRIREGCDPKEFYEEIREWFKGQPDGTLWVWEGIPQAKWPQKSMLSGPSAGQSSLVHAFDIFLGVDGFSHRPYPPPTTPQQAAAPSFLQRMQLYMPRHHRAFLAHLSAAPRPIRTIVQQYTELTEAYNEAVGALKLFRDSHIRVVTSYIIAMAAKQHSASSVYDKDSVLKGTGGTDLAQFLKATRDGTRDALLQLKA